MKTIFTIDTITFTAAMLLMALFGYTAVSKILEYHKFVFQMKLSPVPLMASLATTIGWLIPLVEFFIAVCLFFETWRMKGLYLSLSLLLAFQIYIMAMLLSGLDLPCTCGGVISKMSWKTHLLFNGVFMFIALVPILLSRKPEKSNREYSPHQTAGVDYNN